jgi:Domain of unknown function (DUF4389)
MPPMEPHPIRIVVTDDLARNRLTVFFRLLLVIPHVVWFVLWSIAAVLAAIANWFATLITGRSPDALHDFLSAYVRYGTHLYAYLYLAANPYPGFLGQPETYPVDLEIDPPEPQNRWLTGFRIFLALPPLVLAGVLAGSGFEDWGWGWGWGGGDDRGRGSFSFVGGVAAIVAFFAWFACLVRGRMPGGFRDLVAWALRYSAQASGYLFLLTDRYPSSDPFQPRGLRPDRPLAVRLSLTDDLRRSRLTVFFRILLALPHIVWATLWSYAVAVVALISWFAALVTGRTPDPFHRFMAAFVRYQTHVYAYLLLAANPFPGFTGTPGYPAEVAIDDPAPQSRLITGFRLFLALPALVVAYVLSVALVVAAIFGWFVSLVRGQMPEGLRNVCAYVIHYWAQVYGYLYLLTERYPYSGPRASRDPVPEPEPEPGPEPSEPEVAAA